MPARTDWFRGFHFEFLRYSEFVLKLTRQQQFILSVVLLLFLTGLAVKAWRAGHATEPAPRSELR
ncbi:MAG TPA: hypothetical protein VNO52_18420 [Methylomirabilota bacterium]|nr:hypothetical protein [Methylomirabilota bacterium]